MWRIGILVAAVLLLAPPAARGDALVDVRGGALPVVPGVEPTGHGSRGWTGAVVTEQGLQALRDTGLDVRVRIRDLAARERADRAADAAFAAQGPSQLPSGRATYRRLPDYEADLDRLAEERPGLVAPLALSPPTLEGRTLRGVEITHDVRRRDGKPVLLMVGLHHAREWPSGEHAIEFAYDLVRSDGRDPRITRLLDRVRVIVVPVVNADGFNASRESPIDTDDPNAGAVIGIPGNGSAYRRKNCRASGQTGFTQPPIPCDAATGVDLNRNYGIHWGSNGASSFEEAPDFRGAGPFSEPESEAVRRLVASRQVTMLITNHTFGDQVLRPPGLASVGEVPDEPALKALGDRMAAANGYVSERSWELYDNSGTTEDWSYGVTGGFGYTFEINPENFHPPYEQAVVGEYLGTGEHAGRGNREAYLLALEAAADRAGHAVIEGFAPPGAVLRLQRTVRWQTGPVCVSQPTGFFSTPCGATTDPLPGTDTLTSERRVGRDGVVSWHVNPSKAPLATGDEPWTLTCSTADGRELERRRVELARGTTETVTLRCGEPPCASPRVLRRIDIGPAGTVRVRPARAARGRVAGRAVRFRRGRATLPRLRDGIHVLRLRSGRDVRRIALVVRDGRVRRGPRFARPPACGELSVARLARPAARRPVLLLRPRAALRATVRAGGRTRRLSLPIAKTSRVRLPAGSTVVRVRTSRGTAAARKRSRVTLRGLRR